MVVCPALSVIVSLKSLLQSEATCCISATNGVMEIVGKTVLPATSSLTGNPNPLRMAATSSGLLLPAAGTLQRSNTAGMPTLSNSSGVSFSEMISTTSDWMPASAVMSMSIVSPPKISCRWVRSCPGQATVGFAELLLTTRRSSAEVERPLASVSVQAKVWVPSNPGSA